MKEKSCIFGFYSNDQVTEKAKLKKWGILHFSKKPRTPQSSTKSSEGITLTKEVISQMKQLIEYLSQEKCKKTS